MRFWRKLLNLIFIVLEERMGRKSDLSPRKISGVESLLKHTEKSQREIARIFGIGVASVNRVKRRLENGQSLEAKRRGKCGRKRITTPRTDRMLFKMSLNNRKLTNRSLMIGMAHQYNTNLSLVTIRRRLKEAGLNARRPRKKPKLTPRMIKQRMDWAKEYAGKDVDFWKGVVFTDESKFEILQENTQYVRRRPGEEFKPECVVSTVKHPTSVMVWSQFSWKGTGRLYIVEGTMDQKQYKNVLNTRFLPQVKEWYSCGRAILLHDGAPCHRAKSIDTFLKDNDINVMKWPGNSPDMNPIENIWSIVKKRISTRFPTNKNALIEALIDVWCRDAEVKELCTTLVEGMPRRVKALLDAKGLATKY